MGASLLVFANKTDVGNCMTDEEIRLVCMGTKSFAVTSNELWKILTNRFCRVFN